MSLHQQLFKHITTLQTQNQLLKHQLNTYLHDIQYLTLKFTVTTWSQLMADVRHQKIGRVQQSNSKIFCHYQLHQSCTNRQSRCESPIQKESRIKHFHSHRNQNLSQSSLNSDSLDPISSFQIKQTLQSQQITNNLDNTYRNGDHSTSPFCEQKYLQSPASVIHMKDSIRTLKNNDESSSRKHQEHSVQDILTFIDHLQSQNQPNQLSQRQKQQKQSQRQKSKLNINEQDKQRSKQNSMDKSSRVLTFRNTNEIESIQYRDSSKNNIFSTISRENNIRSNNVNSQLINKKINIKKDIQINESEQDKKSISKLNKNNNCYQTVKKKEPQPYQSNAKITKDTIWNKAIANDSQWNKTIANDSQWNKTIGNDTQKIHLNEWHMQNEQMDVVDPEEQCQILAMENTRLRKKIKELEVILNDSTIC